MTKDRTMQLTTGLKALALAVLLVTTSACKDDDNDSFSFGLDSTQNNPPVISGTPRIKARAGERYQFTPRAADPDGQPLTFSVANLPGWLSFDAGSGRISGTPRSNNVGSFGDVTISVSDGAVRKTLAPFSIRVEASGTTPSEPPVSPPEMPSAGGPFRFAEIPEIVFVRGYRETEHLGIFHLDTRNRWTPGDLRNESGWRPRVETRLAVIEGNVDGVNYDSATGILSYDGTGNGTATARVRLVASTESASSQEFRVRVLEPTVAWGAGAAGRFPGIGLDSASTSWNAMQRGLKGDAPYDSPNVLIVTPGTYSEDFYLQRGLLNLYVIGEPGTRPVLAHDNLNLDGLETGYLKNLELHDTTVNTGSNLADREVNLYITQVYQHDSTRDANGFKAPPGSPRAGGSWRYWFWNFHGSQMGWQSNLRHQMYIEGRLDSRLLINNIRITGTKQCSGVKSTRSFISIRNSYLSGLLDELNLAVGMRSDKIVDVASAADVVIYNNDLVGAFSQDRWGVHNGLVFLRARRGMWGADSPAYPDISFDPPQSSVRPGFAPQGFTAGPETFVNPEFWNVVRSYDIADPANPYSFKKYIAYNRFRWLSDDGSRRQSVFRDDGTAPREAAFQGSTAEIWGTVPQGWVERSVSFFANNRYEGWTAEDMADPRRWFDLNNHPAPSQVEKSGPGPWPYPPPPRAAVFVGGEQRPETQTAPIEMPDWFRI
jgi:Putative Ig domain